MPQTLSVNRSGTMFDMWERRRRVAPRKAIRQGVNVAYSEKSQRAHRRGGKITVPEIRLLPGG